MDKYQQKVLLNQNPMDFYEKLSKEDSQRELLMTGIRMLAGVKKADFSTALKERAETISTLISEGYLEDKGDTLKLTPKGLLFYDDVAADLI